MKCKEFRKLHLDPLLNFSPDRSNYGIFDIRNEDRCIDIVRIAHLQFRIYRLWKREGRNRKVEYFQRMNISTSIRAGNGLRVTREDRGRRNGEDNERKGNEGRDTSRGSTIVVLPIRINQAYLKRVLLFRIYYFGEARLSLRLDEVARLSPLPSPSPVGKRRKKIFSRVCWECIDSSRYSSLVILIQSSSKERFLAWKSNDIFGGGDFLFNKENFSFDDLWQNKDETSNPLYIYIYLLIFLWRSDEISSIIFEYMQCLVLQNLACHTTEPHFC